MTVVPMSQPGRFSPLSADHPLVGKLCPLCERDLRAGERPSLIRKDGGEVHGLTVECVGAHELCVFGVVGGAVAHGA